ncbi:hypothetical protein WA1_22550 [Scytonema hofmannii PCC 7110]|uniref:VWA containing CoxE family protein n=1 Tax=Scytonema hofmannii PCC 7110 TaxID=128403 RepID=A0A139X975_9CYAN|nr:hypothetical protein WA1_22550 [Scytonema hofmannii PCC 7110]
MNELPLVELFNKLREAGLPIGIDEYQSVLQAMQAGFGISDKANLKRLCQTLWVKSTEEQRIFEYYFEHLMGSETLVPGSETLVKSIEKRKIDRLIDCLALIGAFIIGVGIISSGIGFFMNKNPISIINNPTSPSSAPTSTTNPTETKEANPSPTPVGTIAPKPSQVDWSSIAQILLGVGLVFVTGTSLAAFTYRFYTWITKWLLSKQKVSNDNNFSKATPSEPSSFVLPTTLTQATKDEVQVAQAVLQSTSRNEEIFESHTILTSEYFPITERQMKQIWRYLRRPIREGAATELDVEATVHQIGHKGLLLELVLVPRRINRAELLLLIDQDGSMVPFHALSHRLVKTALGGGRLGRAGIYYFHNCPLNYLYHDPNHLEAELVSNIVTSISDRSAVLIFSDAGAARGGYSKERYELTQEFLVQLKQRVRYIAWLNPMPKKRWFGTTANEIAHLVPMFELTRSGVQDAISVLRGRSTNFKRRKK